MIANGVVHRAASTGPSCYVEEQLPLFGSSGRGQLVGFSDVVVRHAFIRKVYAILSFQLILATCLAGVIIDLGESWVHRHPNIVAITLCLSTFSSVGSMIISMCYPDALRTWPTNYAILAVFTVANAVTLGFVCLQYSVHSLLFATGFTALIMVALTIFACQTSFDFTSYGPYLFVAGLVMSGFGFCFMMGGMLGVGGSSAFKTMHLIYSAIGALMMSCYIVYDTQLIAGGKHHQHQFSLDDYAHAAISLYTDIIQLFFFVLRTFGDRK